MVGSFLDNDIFAGVAVATPRRGAWSGPWERMTARGGGALIKHRLVLGEI